MVKLPPLRNEPPLARDPPDIIVPVEKLTVPKMPVEVRPFSPVKLVRVEFLSCKELPAPTTIFPPLFWNTTLLLLAHIATGRDKIRSKSSAERLMSMLSYLILSLSCELLMGLSRGIKRPSPYSKPRGYTCHLAR
jgi:hypothetical protein